MALLESATRGVPAGPPEGVDRSTRTTAKRRFRGDKLTPYYLALPTMLLVIGLLGYPLVRMFIVSLQKYGRAQLLGNKATSWAGFHNYSVLFGDSVFWNVVKQTILFTVAAVVISVVVGMAVAVLMGRVSKPIRYVMTTAMMLVWAMPALVSSQVFVWMIDADFGVLNWLIDQIPGVDFFKHSWFADPMQGWIVITALVLWQGLPFLAITLYAGLTQVPKELVEAANIDGAGPWRTFWSVKLPVVRPLLGIVTTLSVIWDFQLFTQVWALRFGHPEPYYQTLATYAYSTAFSTGRYDMGSAISLVMVLILVFAMIFYVRQMFRVGEAD